MIHKPPALQMMTVGAGEASRAIAFRRREGGVGPTWVWLGGFRSDMASTKASALDAHCAAAERPFLRFDYSGHGESAGEFTDGTISRWLEESLATVREQTAGPVLLIGSSMGGYLALLLARALHATGQSARLAGMVLIAPALDMTESLLWASLPAHAKAAIESDGVWSLPSAYGSNAFPVTRALIEDGRRNLLMGSVVRTHCPAVILQGAMDPDVPLAHTQKAFGDMAMDPVMLTIVKDGDHRLSRPQDLAMLIAAAERLSAP